ncbi:MAG: hypothetical protein HY811_00740 [Planctomycetes bacterium]|nr:hypothetical protein [Planctomycetota bacterium]
MSPPSIIGIKYAAIGILAACVVFIIAANLFKITPSVGLAAGTMGGMMAAMMILTAHEAYKRGKKEDSKN